MKCVDHHDIKDNSPKSGLESQGAGPEPTQDESILEANIVDCLKAEKNVGVGKKSYNIQEEQSGQEQACFYLYCKSAMYVSNNMLWKFLPEAFAFTCWKRGCWAPGVGPSGLIVEDCEVHLRQP